MEMVFYFHKLFTMVMDGNCVVVFVRLTTVLFTICFDFFLLIFVFCLTSSFYFQMIKVNNFLDSNTL